MVPQERLQAARDGLKKFTQKQKDIAGEIGYNHLYFNRFVGGSNDVGELFIIKLEDWLAKQKETA